MTVPTRTELLAETERLFREQQPDAPQQLDPKDPKQTEFVKAWLAIRDDVVNEWTNKVFFERFPNAGKLDPNDPGDDQLIAYWRDIRDQIRDDKKPRYDWDAGPGAVKAAPRADDWDSDSVVIEAYGPSGKVEFRGDLHSSDNRDRVLHPSDGVGYEFNKSVTDVEMLRKRIESLPADIQAALKRGDANTRVTIVASASLPGSEAGNKVLSEARGQDMAKAMRDLGVKSAIETTAVGEGLAAEVDTPDVDNPASRVATFAVEIRKPVAPPDPIETPSPADDDHPVFEVPKTREEAVAEAIEKELKGVKPSLDLRKAISAGLKLQWLAAAAGYAGASASIAKDNMEAGFAEGMVVGADGRSAEQLADLFWQHEPTKGYPNDLDGKVAQNNFNAGLKAGFKQANELSPDQRQRMSDEVKRALGDDAWRGDESSWGTKEYREFYRDAAGKVRALYMTNPGPGN
jgi:hypothetical protein